MRERATATVMENLGFSQTSHFCRPFQQRYQATQKSITNQSIGFAVVQHAVLTASGNGDECKVGLTTLRFLLSAQNSVGIQRSINSNQRINRV